MSVEAKDTKGRLKLKSRTVKTAEGGKVTYWVARGSVPLRQDDGTVYRDRITVSLSDDFGTKKEREDEVARLNQWYEDKALAGPKPPVFSLALKNYVGAGNPLPDLAEKLIERIGEKLCSEIDDTTMVTLRQQLFAAEAKPSYVNRHLYTPVNAILQMAAKGKKTWSAPVLTRPKGHKISPPIEIPKRDWFKLVMPHCTPNVRAICAFLTVHGRRLGEALGRSPDDYNSVERTLFVGRDKNGDPRLIELLPEVAQLIESLPVWDKLRDGPPRGPREIVGREEAIKRGLIRYFTGKPCWREHLSERFTSSGNCVACKQHRARVKYGREQAKHPPPEDPGEFWLFGFGKRSGSNVRDDLLKACCLASGLDRKTTSAIVAKPSEHKAEIAALSVPYFTPHELGRHSFATRLLRAGYSLQYLKDAGGWKTIEMPANRYGHLEKKEVTTAVHQIGGKLAKEEF